MKKANYIIIATIITLLAGCYTILEHPDVAEKDDNGNLHFSNVDYQNDCLRCHANAHTDYVSDYDRYHNYYQSTVNNPSPRDSWNGYYQIPWWYSPTPVAIRSNGGGIPENNNNLNDTRTTSAPESRPDIRNAGTTRGSVNTPSLPSPAIIRDSRTSGTTGGSVTNTGSGTSSGNTSGSTNVENTNRREERSTSTNNDTQKNTETRSNDRNSGSSGNSGSANTNNSNSNADTNKRNTGSTRGRN